VRNITFAAFMDLDWFRALVDPNRECRLESACGLRGALWGP